MDNLFISIKNKHASYSEGYLGYMIAYEMFMLSSEYRIVGN